MLSVSPYKKKYAPKYKKRYGTSRPWSTYNPRRALWNPTDPYSDSFVHKFRRLGQIARLTPGAGNVPFLLEDASPNPNFALGPNSNDFIAGLNLLQFGVTFTAHLDGVINYTDFIDLFNEYKIDKVDIRIDLINGPSAQPNVAGVLPELYVRYDPNDASMPTSFGDIAQSANTTLFTFSQKTTHHFSFVPKASVQCYANPSSGGAVGFAAPSHQALWFDTTGPSNNIHMYGLKFWFRNYESTLGNGQLFQFQPTYFLSARRPR